MSDRVEQLTTIQNEALELFKNKNTDYGDAFATYGPVGVLVRIGDKLSRFTSISNSGVTLVNTEGMRDTLIDLHNYSAMAIMLLDENARKLKQLAIEEVIEQTNRGLTIQQILSNGYSMEALKIAGISASQFRSSGFNAIQLKNISFTLNQLITAGFTLNELVLADFLPEEFRALNFSNTQLNHVGFTTKELYDISYCDHTLPYKVKEDHFFKQVFNKKLKELRRDYDDEMTLREGGNRLNYSSDHNLATQYASEARSIFKNEYYTEPTSIFHDNENKVFY